MNRKSVLAMNRIEYYIGRLTSHCIKLSWEANAVRQAKRLGLINVESGNAFISGNVKIGEHTDIRRGIIKSGLTPESF